MFFFYPIHNKNYAKTPTIDAQSHIIPFYQRFPISLVLPAAMNVPDYHHRIFIFENQWIITDKTCQSVIQIIVKLIVISGLFRRVPTTRFQHLLIKVKNQRRMQMVFPLCLDTIFQITDNH